MKDGDYIKLYIKGADNKIKEKLGNVNQGNIIENCTSNINEFSALGYRSLLVGMKILSYQEYFEWKQKVKEASSKDLENKDAKLQILYSEIEENITLLGATIVEDKLQDDVPETIRDLRLAGIKVWMLTGDKLDTAINIALSCNLLSNSIKSYIIETIVEFLDCYKELSENKKIESDDYSIVVECSIFPTIFESEEGKEKFLFITKNAKSVICCRASPGQKRDVVSYIKESDKKAVTLAIGDGGNDVSMITEAHLGVGVYGEEGMIAVQASDFSIGEFKFLRRLLFFHGRVNYLRIADMIPYFFYKNYVFTIIQFYYAYYNNCSGQSLLDSMFITLYNLLFTACPLVGRACMDFDLKPDDGIIINKLMPFLYKESREFPIFLI